MAVASPGTRISDFIAAGELYSVYQPVVDLIGGDVVAYEALARGRPGSAYEVPDLMFAAAREQGCIAELDAACRAVAVDGALAAQLAPPLTLFVNIEPGAADGTALLGPEHEALLAEGALRVVLEFTERELMSRPAEVLALVRRCRNLGCGIALDDVGEDPHSLALFPFLSPDVIKLDMRLTQDRTAEVARTIYAVAAEAERYGASVLAEGIESEEHREMAIAVGAQLAQGRLFGSPGPLPTGVSEPARTVIWRRSTPPVSTASPFQIISAHRPVRRADHRLLSELSRQLEVQAAALAPEAVVLTEFQHARFFSGTTAIRYGEFAPHLALVAAISVDMPSEPAPGVRGTALDPDDPLAGGWTIAVISPHYAAALAAVECPHPAKAQKAYDFAITLDRELVIAAALTLMQRVIAAEPGRTR